MDLSIKKFFYPESICIAGASTKEKSIGYELLKTIQTNNYLGKIFPVNPKAEIILGYKCYKNISDIEENIDLGIIVVPKQFAEDSIDELLTKNVKSIILITAGFKEIGDEGRIIEERILQKIKAANARLVGPNCMGVINTLEDIQLNATFVAEKPEKGKTGFFSQSGALGAAVLNSLRETDIKFAHFISAGNKADINENDILKFWHDDENISTLAFYLESFESGRTFIQSILNFEKRKPVLVLKSGRTQSGMKAASSHTGALGSQDRIVDAVLNQFGVIRANDLNELFNTAKGLENFNIPNGNRVAVITNAGGPAILTVDSLEKRGLVLSQFDQTTKNELRKIVHPEGSIENPIDLLPGGSAEIFRRVNEIVAMDSNVDAIISIFVEPVMVNAFDVVDSNNSIISDKPIFQVVMPLPEFWTYYKNNSLYKKPLFRNPEDPATVISNLLISKKYVSADNRLLKRKTNLLSDNNNGFISQKDVEHFCNVYALPLVKQIEVVQDQLSNLGKEFFPAVIKGISKEVVHKSELQAVELNLKNKDDLISAAYRISSNFQAHNIKFEKFLIQNYVETKFEILLGGTRDPSFGPVIMFGSGGKYVEIYNDISIKSAYLSNDDIEQLIFSTNIGKILKGVRGDDSADIEKLKSIITAVAQMMIDNDNISEFDINPLILTKQNEFLIVDMRIKIN